MTGLGYVLVWLGVVLAWFVSGIAVGMLWQRRITERQRRRHAKPPDRAPA